MAQTRRDKADTKRVAGTGRVDAVDGESRCANLAAARARKASLFAQRYADNRRPKLVDHRLERTPEILMAGELTWKTLCGHDDVDVLQQLTDRRPDPLDVDDCS